MTRHGRPDSDAVSIRRQTRLRDLVRVYQATAVWVFRLQSYRTELAERTNSGTRQRPRRRVFPETVTRANRAPIGAAVVSRFCDNIGECAAVVVGLRRENPLSLRSPAESVAVWNGLGAGAEPLGCRRWRAGCRDVVL